MRLAGLVVASWLRESARPTDTCKFVAKDGTPVAVKQGDSLDGYVVKSIGADAIMLGYPPLGNKAIIAMSPAQSM